MEELYISIISAILAIAATLVSVWTLFETRRMTQLAVHLEMLEFGNEILLASPETLRLHGISATQLEKYGMNISDFLYLLNSFYSGQSYFAISGKKKVVLSAYRKNMLVQPGIKEIWQEFIRGKMIAESPYAKAIDEFYKENK